MQDNLLASGSEDKTVQVWNMQTKKKLAQFQHEDQVLRVQFHNNWLITLDKSVKIWDEKTAKVLHSLSHSASCRNFDLNPDRTLLAVACKNAVVLWDFKTVTKIEEFVFEKQIRNTRFNPAGNKLIVGALDGEVYKVDLVFDSNN